MQKEKKSITWPSFDGTRVYEFMRGEPHFHIIQQVVLKIWVGLCVGVGAVAREKILAGLGGQSHSFSKRRVIEQL